MLSNEERRAVAIYEATGDLYKAAERAGLAPVEVLHAVGISRRMHGKRCPSKNVISAHGGGMA